MHWPDFETDGVCGKAAKRLLQLELRPGERVVWIGGPLRGWYAIRALPLVLLGLCFVGGCAWFDLKFGMKDSARRAGDDHVFIIPLLAAGYAMIWSPLWMYWRARRMCYAVTDQRVIIVWAGFFGGLGVESYGPANLQSMRRRQISSERGDLILEEIRTGEGQLIRRRGFWCIREAAGVEDLIRKVVLKS